MKKFTFALVILSLLVVGLSETVHATMPDHACSHHQMDHDDHADNEPCHSEYDQSHDENGCDDCCCVHSHSMAAFNLPLNTPISVQKQNIIASVDNHYSAELSGLRRPPRL